MQKFSYHTHTDFSDGQVPLAQMLEKAVELGWSEIGITDHAIIHENMQTFPEKEYFAPRYNRFCFDDFAKAYEILARNIESIRRQTPLFPLKVYVGFEVDFFTYDGWQEKLSALKERLDIDYLISGNHFLSDENCQILIRRDYLPQVTNGEADRKAWIARHFKTVARAAASGLFAFMAHIDAMRRLPDCGEDGFITERCTVIEAMKKSGTACEVNTKGLCKGYNLYPSAWTLSEMLKAKIPVVISDDAHRPEFLGRNFAEAENILAGMNYTYRFKF